MKKALFVLAIGTILLASCSKEQKHTLTESQIKTKVDSIVSARASDIAAQYAEDLDRRMAIEVKVKTDSLVQACQGTSAPLPPEEVSDLMPPVMPTAEP